MQSNNPEYFITFTDVKDGDDTPTLETCDHPRDVLQWLESHQILTSRVSIAEWDKDTDDCVERLNGDEWLEKYTVVDSRRRLR